MDEHTPARPGKPGQYRGRRLRWRSVVRATRDTNREAVAELAREQGRALRMRAWARLGVAAGVLAAAIATWWALVIR